MGQNSIERKYQPEIAKIAKHSAKENLFTESDFMGFNPRIHHRYIIGTNECWQKAGLFNQCRNSLIYGTMYGKQTIKNCRHTKRLQILPLQAKSWTL